VRNELYGFLLFAGAVAVFIAFSFLALNYLLAALQLGL
jgi:hypothetical protein